MAAPLPTTYSYPFSSFLNGKVDSNRLIAEIRASSIITALDHIGTDADAQLCTVSFKDVLSASDETTLAGIVSAHTGAPLAENVPMPVTLYAGANKLQPQTDDQKQIVSIWPAEGTKTSGYSMNWCDKTTWYSSSVYVAAETPSAVVAGLSYQLAHANVIDMTHGKVPFENAWVDDASHLYPITVRVDGVVKAELDPHTNSGDYTVNYATGVVTFAPAISPTAVVSVDYHYATTSTYILKPDAGKMLKIRRVKARLTADVVMNDSIKFQLYLGGSPYGPSSIYKTILNVLSESDEVIPSFPVIGGGSWRGLAQAVYTLKWDYLAMIPLRSSLGMEVHVELMHDTAFGGTFAGAGFDCFVLNE